jgi:uncharacterized delta-60 repeat protein
MNLRSLLVAGIVAVSTSAGATPNYDGALDASFGFGGLADYASLARLEPSALLRQPDGRLVVVGTTSACNVVCGDRLPFVMRLLADGTPDPSSTIRTFGLAPNDANAAALTPSGDLLIVGSYPTGGRGRGTIVHVSGDAWTVQSARPGELNAVVALADGGYVVAGSAVHEDSGDRDFYVARFDASNAELAETIVPFNKGGDNDDRGLALAVADDRVYVAGQVDLGTHEDGTPDTNCALAVLKLDTLALDERWDTQGPSPGETMFGFDGNFEFPTADICRSIAVQPDRRVVIGGEVYVYGNGMVASFWTLTRYLPSGRGDSEFGVDATFQTYGYYNTLGFGYYNGLGALAIQSDGKIVVAGYAASPDEGSAPADFGIARVTSNGSLDVSFGATRVGATAIGYLVDEGQGGLGSTQYATAMLLDAGRPVIAGPNYRYPDSDGLVDTMLVRLDADLIFVDTFDASAVH